jgi:hypothetical protein
MKHILFILLATILVIGCQKDFKPNNQDYIQTVQKALKDSLTTIDFQSLDFSRSARSRVDSVGLYFFRIPFKGLKPNEHFVLVKTNESGNIEKGKIVHLQGKINELAQGGGMLKSWDGKISLSSLDRKKVLESPVSNGYITVFHQNNRYRTDSHEAEGHVMPEIIITYIRPYGGGVHWSTWFMVQNIVSAGATSGSGSGGHYGDFSGGDYASNDGGGYGGGGGGSTGADADDPVIYVDRENQDLLNEIDIKRYVSCFNSIPDAGATCSIEISADIPVDDNPNAFFDFRTGSPGHVFLTIRKKNGSQQASQNIGFYPKSGYKAMTYAPTAGKLVDNAGHEFNASLFMNISPDQLSSVLTRMQQLSNLSYDVDGYNCTDWALDIFNSVRTDKLTIPLYGIPNSPMTQGSQTPQGLFHKMQQMMESNHPEKGNLTIGILKGYAGGSTGPCN